MNNTNIQENLSKYIAVGKLKNIHCLNTSKITNMNSLVSGYSYPMFQSFNTDLSCWDVSSVTSMMYMFDTTSEFNNNISSWDVSSVTDMTWMFYEASSFNTDLSSWNVSSVTDM